MTRQEALNIAWHVRTNGLDGVKPEQITEAFAALERDLTALEAAAETVLSEIEGVEIPYSCHRVLHEMKAALASAKQGSGT